jgi:hypothetical protein
MLWNSTMNGIKKGLAGLILVGALLFVGGCEISIDGFDDFGDWLIEIVDDCDYCGDDIIIEFDD